MKKLIRISALMLLIIFAVSGCFGRDADPLEDTVGMPAEGYGNTLGNITNGGVVAFQEGWVYYCNGNDDVSIYKMRINGSEKTKLNSDRSMFLNVQGDWVYYSNIEETEKSSIYKVKTDGTKRTKLTNDSASFINVVDEWIYYSNASDNRRIYKIKTDGTEKTLIGDKFSSYLNLLH